MDARTFLNVDASCTAGVTDIALGLNDRVAVPDITTYMREPLHGTPYTTREVRAHLTLMQLRDMGAMQGLLFVTGCMN